MRDLVEYWKADLLILNPLSAYHDGDISQNKDNLKFLYGELGRLLDELKIGIFAFHHKVKPLRGKQKSNGGAPADIYHDMMYDALGGSMLTNFFRAMITVAPVGDSNVFKFTVSKRFEQSGWPVKSQQYKWHEDRKKQLWVSASIAETQNASNSGKDLHDLRKLIPALGAISREELELESTKARFTQKEYRGFWRKP